jgi:hypothetical protein
VLTTRRDPDLPEEAAEPTPGFAAHAEAAPAHAVCPFARRGLDSTALRGCPGYAAQTVSFAGLGAGESLGERESCAHLGTQRGGRGFVSACRHPGGRPAAAEEMARRADRAQRRGGGSPTGN